MAEWNAETAPRTMDGSLATRPTPPPTRDEKGRALPEDMTDRELLEETVRTLRAVGDALAPFMDPELAKLGPLGIMRAMLTGGK